MLEAFALIILIVVALAGIAVWVLLAMAPGKIAKSRNHPQADAINVCGWWGAVTLGLLTPLAFIWAYTKPGAVADPEEPAHQAADEGAQ